MRLSNKKIIIMSGIVMIVMFIVFIAAETSGENKITMQKLFGIWWTCDANQVPWAIQFNEDGSYRMAHTVLRLDKMPQDEGKFQLEETSLTLISNKDCEGSCKGLEGNYKVEFTKYDKLMLIEQADQCMERKEICQRPWSKVVE